MDGGGPSVDHLLMLEYLIDSGGSALHKYRIDSGGSVLLEYRIDSGGSFLLEYPIDSGTVRKFITHRSVPVLHYYGN